jgi:hypothetical protein
MKTKRMLVSLGIFWRDDVFPPMLFGFFLLVSAVTVFEVVDYFSPSSIAVLFDTREEIQTTVVENPKAVTPGVYSVRTCETTYSWRPWNPESKVFRTALAMNSNVKMGQSVKIFRHSVPHQDQDVWIIEK